MKRKPNTMDYHYETVDVFTTTRFGGNPLAVILDAQGLSDRQMQQIAAEFNYSETTFVLPPENPANTARVRIFTPTAEVPFAGHPNVGTAFVLARRGAVLGRPVPDQMRFEERAGLVAVEVVREAGEVHGAAITAPQPLSIGDELPPELIAACASLELTDLSLKVHPPRRVSVGLPFVVAELASREALARARPSPQHFEQADKAYPEPASPFALFLYVPTGSSGLTLAARMFAPLDNVSEDPATGSASAALVAYLATLTPGDELDAEATIHQGEDMGRPSRIELQVRKRAGSVEGIVVRGACVPVMAGSFTI